MRRYARSAGLALALAVGLSQLPAEAEAAPPANDNFADREIISGLPFTDMTSNVEATLETGEQQPQASDCTGFQITGTVWYEFTPASASTLQADTFGSSFDTMVGVWTGDTPGSLTEVGCNDQAPGSDQSRVILDTVAGTTYLFQVGGWEGSSGTLTFNLDTAPPLGSISGTVQAMGGGALPGICVAVFDEANFGFYGEAITGPAGEYEVGGLPTGTYIVGFGDYCDGSVEYLEQWYDHNPSAEQADPVLVTAPNETTGIDADLSLGAVISGTVRAAGGAELPGICVLAFDTDSFFFGEAITGPAGEYRIGGLPAGTYIVVFGDYCDESVEYIEESYDDSPSPDQATPVSVTPPNEVSGIDAELALGAFIEGRVTDAATRQPLADVCVEAYEPNIDWYGFDVTEQTGMYRLGGLKAGSYVVSFFHCPLDGPEGYHSESFDNKTFETADLISVVPPDGVQGIDAALVPLSGPATKQVLLSAKPKKVDRGKRTTLAVQILPCGGEAGDLVEFYRGNVKLGDVVTGPSCTAELRVRVRRTSFFQAVSPGDADLQGGFSPLVKVKVRKRPAREKRGPQPPGWVSPGAGEPFSPSRSVSHQGCLSRPPARSMWTCFTSRYSL